MLITFSSSRSVKENPRNDVEKINYITEKHLSEDENPIYVNLSDNNEKLKNRDTYKTKTNSLNSRQRKSHKTDISKHKTERTTDVHASDLSNSDRTKERRSDSGTDNSLRKKHSANKDTISRSAYKDTLSRRVEKSDKQRPANDLPGKVTEELNTSSQTRKPRESKLSNEKKSTIEKKNHRSRSLQRPTSKDVPEEPSKDLNRMIVKKAGHKVKDSLDDNHGINSNRKRNSSRDKSTKETIKPSQKQDSNYTLQIPPINSKSNGKEYAIKPNGYKSNMRKEYVINYDDKNGTVSSVCSKIKIAPDLGTPKRKKSSKEIFKDSQNDKAFKNKAVKKLIPRK